MDMPTYSCPSCGGNIDLKFRYTKLMTCPHCGNALLLEDQALKLRGQSAVMADYPALLQLNQWFSYKKVDYLPVGQVRFEYSHGFWDEWWVVDSKGEGGWISIDEGDIAFERPFTLVENLMFPDIVLGETIRIADAQWLVTERDQATCVALQGELPEILREGEQMSYAHLSGGANQLLTVELTERGLLAYKGKWIDPFEIKMLT